MIKELGTVTLRSGETMKLTCVEPPEADWRERLTQFYSHKPEIWFRDLVKRLNGERAAVARDYIFIGTIGGELVGGICIFMPRDTCEIGVLGHVWTPEKHRQKGISDALMTVALQRFKDEGGRALYLDTGNPIARRIYEKHGFRFHNPPVSEMAAIFLWLPQGELDFESRFFTPKGKLRARELHWGDWPKLEALYNIPEHPWMVKDESLAVYRYAGWEPHFLRVMGEVEDGLSVCLVGEDSQRRVLALARLTRVDRQWMRHIGALEFFAAPSCFGELPQLINDVLARRPSLGIEQVRAYAASGDRERVEILLRHGFKEIARLKGQFKMEAAYQDLLVFALQP